EALAARACVVVTDDFPAFFLPAMIAAAAQKLSVRLEAVDSNGLLPLRATDQVFHRAVDFRRFLQKSLPEHLLAFPSAKPFAQGQPPPAPALPKSIPSRWPSASEPLLAGGPSLLARLPIDHAVTPAKWRGGHPEARKRLQDFLASKL